jgi:hypothetical protein
MVTSANSLTREVSDDYALRQWVLGLGRFVRVIGPPSVVEWILDELDRTRHQYAYRLTRDEDERPGLSGVALLANAKHHFAVEDVEAFIAPVMRVGPRTHCSRRHSPLPHGAQAVGFRGRNLDVAPVPADPTAMNRPPPGATITAFMGLSSTETRRVFGAATAPA